MPLQIVTLDDLIQLKDSIVKEVRALLPYQQNKESKMLKSPEVCKMLRISHGTLQNLRKNKTILAKKVGGTYYYLYDDIAGMLPRKVG